MAKEINLDRYRNSIGILDPVAHWSTPILIVGAWGTGSMSAVVLAKMWMSNITIVDFDEVEYHNVQSQFYGENDIWTSKVHAIKKHVLEQSWIEIRPINDKYHPDMSSGMEIVYCAVDDMDVRKQIVEASPNAWLIIDTRMSWAYFELLAFPGILNRDYIENDWFPQSEVEETLCSMKSVSYNCFGVASMVWSVVRNYLVWEAYPHKIMFGMSSFYLDVSY